MHIVTDVESILQNWRPGHIPPVSWMVLARKARRQQLRPLASWPPPMVEAYRQTQAICNAADALTSAYLVSIGEGGELQ